MRIGRLIWATPLVFLIHDAEELATIAPFLQAHKSQLPAIVQSVADVTTSQFAVAVVVLFLVIVAAAAHGARRAREGALSIFFLLAAGMLVGNAVTHLMQAVYFRGYSPGVLTALLLVLPYGFALGKALESANLANRRAWLTAVAAGVILQVPIVALLLTAVH